MKPFDLLSNFPAGQGTLARRQTILDLLQQFKGDRADLEWKVRKYTVGERTHANVYVRCGKPFAFGTLVEAHFDVLVQESENCSDNTAGVCIALSLARNSEFHGFLAFCDTEELASIEASGASRLREDLKTNPFFKPRPEQIIVLDVAAAGTIIWTDHPLGLASNGGVADTLIQTPFNNATILRVLKQPAACVGLLPYEEAHQRPPDSWRRIHSTADTFDRAVSSDMSHLADLLAKLGKRHAISRPTIQQLHTDTGCGLADCKRTLLRANGDIKLAHGISNSTAALSTSVATTTTEWRQKHVASPTRKKFNAHTFHLMNLNILADAPASILPQDEMLFKTLGLKPYYKVPSFEEFHAGTVQFEDTVVDIHVTPGPITSWRCVVTDPGTRELTTIRTGSGALSDFWPTVELVAKREIKVLTKRLR